MTTSPPPKPMLATRYDPNTILFPVFVQPKLNGIRALCDLRRRRFTSKTGEIWHAPMVERFWRDLSALYRPDTILDGEFYRHGWKLQQISEAMTVVREEPIEITHEVKYHIFDRVSPLAQTDRVLLDFVSNTVETVPSTKVYSTKALDLLHEGYIEQGYEGSIIRLGSAPYIHGLTSALLKRKQRIDFEVQVTGVIEGNGEYKGMLGAFRVEDPVRGVGYKVGSGHFTLELRQRYWDNPPIGQWITIYTEVGVSEKGIPLQAQFEAVRNYE